MFFVGSKSSGYSSTAAQSISLTNLLGIGGASLAVRQGDMVLVNVTHSMATTASRTLAQLTPTDPAAANYSSPLGASVQANDNNAVSLGLFYKFMGASPDTTITLPACAASTNSVAYTIEIWRGVDQTTPFAAIALVTASGANTGLANPSSVSTPASPKGCVVGGAFGAAVAAASVFTNTGATPYDTATNLFSSGVQNTATNRAVSGMGFKRGSAVSTAFDAAITGSTTTNTGSWAAVAFVLKPDQSISTASGISDDFANDNLVAGTPDGFNQNAACTATVTGGELVIQPSNVTVGYNGRHTNNFYSMRGQSIYAALTQAPSGIVNPSFEETFFGFVSDAGGNIGAGAYLNGGGAMTLRRTQSGADIGSGTAYNSTNHFFFKITHNDTNDHIVMDGAPNVGGGPGTWTNIYDVARPADLDVDCCQIAFTGGVFGGGSTPGAVKWDALNTNLTSSISLAPAASACATTSETPAIAPKTTLAPNSSASATTSEAPTPVPHNLMIVAAESIATTTSAVPTLNSNYVLAPNSSASALASDLVTTTARWTLSPAAAAVALTAGSLALAPKTPMSPASSVVAMTSDNVTIANNAASAPAASVAALTADAVTIAIGGILLAPAGSDCTVTAAAVTIATKAALAPNAAAVLLVSASPVLATNALLAPGASKIVTTADAALVVPLLTVASSSLILAADTPALATKAVLTPNSSVLALVSASPAIATAASLAPGASDIVTTSGSPSIAANASLAPAASVSALAAPAVTITTSAVLAPTSADITTISASPALAASAMLAPISATVITKSEDVVLSVSGSLSVASSLLATVADTLTLTVGLIPASSALQLSSDSPAVTPRWSLSPAAAQMSLIASNVVIAPKTTLSPAPSQTATTAETPSIASETVLSVQGSEIALILAAPTVNFGVVLDPAGSDALTTSETADFANDNTDLGIYFRIIS